MTVDTSNWRILQIVPASPGWRARFVNAARQPGERATYDWGIISWALVETGAAPGERFVTPLILWDNVSLGFAAASPNFLRIVELGEPGSPEGAGEQETVLGAKDIALLRKLHAASWGGEGNHAWTTPDVTGLTAAESQTGHDPDAKITLYECGSCGGGVVAEFERARDAAFAATAHAYLPQLLDDLEYLQRRVRELSR